MNTDIDMTYSFLSDEEPTDEQLLALMQEVGEEVRLVQKKVAEQVIENIKRESARVRAARSAQQ